LSIEDSFGSVADLGVCQWRDSPPLGKGLITWIESALRPVLSSVESVEESDIHAIVVHGSPLNLCKSLSLPILTISEVGFIRTVNVIGIRVVALLGIQEVDSAEGHSEIIQHVVVGEHTGCELHDSDLEVAERYQLCVHKVV
jgi:hypothetical protein